MQLFNLTKEERVVLLLFFFLALLGIGLIHCTKIKSSADLKVNLITTPSQRIGLNEASVDELIRISGIGPVLAQRIVAYRQEYGDFRTIAEIKHVKGIGQRKFEKIKDFLILE
jgi:competence ComEA-like helix-hairpin-helix protein